MAKKGGDLAYSATTIEELPFMEGVRKNPGMYIGDDAEGGLHHLPLEGISNAVDEFTAGAASRIDVVIEKNGAMEIADNGRGIPVDWDKGMSALTRVLTRPHAGGKFRRGEESAYSSSGGQHGIGSKAINAMSEWMEVTVRRHGLTFRQRFERGGEPVTGVEIYAGREKLGEITAETTLVLDKKTSLATGIKTGTKVLPVQANPGLGTGTTLRFRPNRAWFSRVMEWPDPTKNVPWDTDRIADRLLQFSFLYPGLRITFLDERVSKEDRVKREFFSKRGLLDYIDYLNEGETPLHKPIEFTASTEVDIGEKPGHVGIEVVMQYAGEETQLVGFVNGIPTPLGGTHFTGFKAGLTRSMRAWIDERRDKDLKGDFKPEDLTLGLTAVIHVTLDYKATFIGQTKDALSNPEVAGAVGSMVYAALSEYLGKPANFSTGKVIVRQALAASRGREAAVKARQLAGGRNALSVGTFVLGKLSDIQRRAGQPMVPVEYTALHIVEGQSAGGSCKEARNSLYQAILATRGKPPNAEKVKDAAKVLENAEVAAIVASVGAGVGQAFDLGAMRYGRIVITVDADIDGAHIATLLITLFWRFMRPLVEAGRLYVARPPLYLVRYKGGQAYAYSDDERDDVIARAGGAANCSVQRYKGLGEMNPEQLRETIFALPPALQAPGGGKRKKKGGDGADAEPGVVQLTIDHFAEKDTRLVVGDVHRVREVIRQLLGVDIVDRREWLMKADWDLGE